MANKKRKTMVVTLAALLASCTFVDGEPWGDVEATLETEAPATPPEVRVEETTVELETARLIETSTSPGGGGGTFDPANPPPGYSLCHGGHCHSDSGELVSYDDIRAEMASGGGTTHNVLGNLSIDEPFAAGERVDLGRASIDQEVTLDTVEVEFAHIHVNGHIERDGEELPLRIGIPAGGVRISTPVDVTIDEDAPETQRLHLALHWPEHLLTEEVDLADVEPTESDGEREVVIDDRPATREVAQQLQGNLAETTLTTSDAGEDEHDHHHDHGHEEEHDH